MGNSITIKIHFTSIAMLGLVATNLLLSCSASPVVEVDKIPKQPHGIDSLLSNLEKLKKQDAYKSTAGLGEMIEADTVSAIMGKSQEELKAILLSVASKKDKGDYARELETVFDVGGEKAFFLRQVGYCRTNLDLAVVGMGIIRVHQVIKGENPTVKKGDRGEYIKYVKDQVQDAIASSNKNYKTIVFKGLESSID